MLGFKEIPARESLIDYNYAVAGHAGTMCDADGELFIKPCVKSEVEFYEVANRRHPEFASIMPLYMGTLSLSEAANANPQLTEQLPPVLSEKVEMVVKQVAEEVVKDGITWVPNMDKKIKTDLAVVLENASAGFKQPNILDVKLGVRLWADDAPQQKKQRFDAIAAATTHRDYGFRIAGMRVYRGGADPDDADLDDEGYKIFDKDYGRVDVNNDNLVDALRGFIFNETAGVDDELGRAVCAAFARDIRRVEEVLASHETRMYSASLLFIFEGDGDALRRAVDEHNTVVEAVVAGEKPARTATRIDSGIGMDDSDSDDEDFDSDEPTLPRIYTLKLIDFAHAKFVPGHGPDENALKGVRSLAKIFEDLSI